MRRTPGSVPWVRALTTVFVFCCWQRYVLTVYQQIVRQNIAKFEESKPQWCRMRSKYFWRIDSMENKVKCQFLVTLFFICMAYIHLQILAWLTEMNWWFTINNKIVMNWLHMCYLSLGFIYHSLADRFFNWKVTINYIGSLGWGT